MSDTPELSLPLDLPEVSVEHVTAQAPELPSFALIDRYSRTVAWIGQAPNAAEACQLASEAEPGHRPGRYERVESSSVDAGFDVYEAPPGAWEETDAADPQWLRSVRAQAFLGIYQPVAPRDLADEGD